MVERGAGAGGGGAPAGRVAVATAAGFGGWGNPPRAPARMWLRAARVRLGGATGAELGARRALWPSRRTVSAPHGLGSLAAFGETGESPEETLGSRCSMLVRTDAAPAARGCAVPCPRTPSRPDSLSPRQSSSYLCPGAVAFLPAVSCLTSGKLAAFQLQYTERSRAAQLPV